MYPLRFIPLFQRYLWGGRRLAEVLGKSIGAETAAESWEIVDHQNDQSVVAYGELAGITLRQLIAEFGDRLLGGSMLKAVSSPDVPEHLRNRFPLLLKFLDANRPLSVQVHPDDRFGATLSPPDLGKTEAWYVMHADPGAKIFAGLKSGVTRQDFQNAVAEGTTESMLHSFEPKQGDCVFIQAGTMHAIGAGLLIAEIQQASNTTFRVYDWGRVGADGKPRPLHIDQALEVTDFSSGPVEPTFPRIANDGWAELVACDKFCMNRRAFDRPLTVAGDGRFHILAVTRGELHIEGDPSAQPLKLGQTALIPAAADSRTLTPGDGGAELLEIHVPS